MATYGLYDESGAVRVNTVPGTVFVGFYSASGQMNVVVVTGSSFTGRTAPCGATNVVNTTGGTTFVGRNHPCGALNVTDSKLESILYGSLFVSGLAATVLPLSQTLIANENDAFAFDFTDDYYQATTGFYGSVTINDSATPANDYDNSPVTAASSLLTYTSPSNKLVMGPLGVLRYPAHNLYINSAAPANQSITVISGMTYEIVITGTVSISWTGAYTGITGTPGTTAFTAASGTLTGGSTSGSGTVIVRRTPCDSVAMTTGATARFDLPFEWNSSGTLIGLRGTEESRANRCLHNSDMTNVAWVKTNTTALRNQTGPNGVANFASTVTATAANGTCLQSITSASAARIFSIYLKRITGTGTIELTMDNGVTWTPVVITSLWERYAVPSATVTNPVVGIRIATSGDEVACSLAQEESGAFITTPIETVAASVTRAFDNITMSLTALPYSATAHSIYIHAISAVTNNTAGSNQRTIAFTEGGVANLTSLFRNNSDTLPTGQVISGGVAQVSIDNGTWAHNTEAKMALAATLNDAASCLSGGTVGTDITVTMPVGQTTMEIGRLQAGLRAWNGYIIAFAGWKRRITDTELQTITAP